MARGRKPVHICPPAAELAAAIERSRLHEVCAEYGIARKTLLRWMQECGMQLPPTKKLRPRVGRTWLDLGLCPRIGRRVRTRLYEVWASMRKRCLVPSCPDFPRYGGRGITICDEWLQDYGAFRSWAVSQGGYRKGLTLDRKDSNGNYEPSNCRFVTKADQQLNIRRAIKLTARGETRSLAEWARVSGVAPDLIRTRYYNGWPHERAIFEQPSR